MLDVRPLNGCNWSQLKVQILPAFQRITMKKKPHGGKRKGAGRPKLKDSDKKEPTKVMRIPESKVDDVKKIIKE